MSMNPLWCRVNYDRLPQYDFCFATQMLSRLEFNELDDLTEKDPCIGCEILPIHGALSDKIHWCRLSLMLMILQELGICKVINHTGINPFEVEVEVEETAS